MGNQSVFPLTSETSKMRAFCIAACLLSVAAGLPSKLGGHSHAAHHSEHRQARQGGGGYIAPREEELSGYGDTASAAAEVVETRAAPEPVGVRSFNMDNSSPNFRYNFETENDIKQEAEGELREVDGTEVVVMRGSYSYIGADGQEYVVDWYADETGYHPSAAPLPVSVEPNHPEVAAAVRAQLEFAAEEEAAAAREAAASSNTASYAAPPLSAYGNY